MDLTLWQLSENLKELNSRITEILEDESIDEGLKDQEVNKVFEEYLGSENVFEEKALKVAGFIRYLESMTVARKSQIKLYQALAKESENRSQKLRKYLTLQMQRVGKKKIEGIGKISLRKKPKQLQVFRDPQDIPHEYQKIVVDYDKAGIKKALTEGKQLDFAKMKDTGEETLFIK